MPRYIHLLILLTLLQIASCTKTPKSPIWNGKADTSWYTTTDTSATEFTIATAEQLAGLAKLVNDGNDFKGKTINLGANIMLNDTVNWQNWATKPPKNKWKPIGKYIEEIELRFLPDFINLIIYLFVPESTKRALRLEPTRLNFEGTFDGNGFVVSGVYINSEETFQGLFGTVRGEIRNLGVIASYIKGREYVGGLVGDILGTVNNSYSTAWVTGTFIIGGLVGTSDGTISNSYFAGVVTGGVDRERYRNNYYVGGLAGSADTVINSYSIVKVTGSGFVGGLVGSIIRGTISNSYSIGTLIGNTIIGNGGCTGGLLGRSYHNNTIVNSYSASIVKGVECVGGLVGGTGEDEDKNISNSYYDMQISGQSDTGKGEGKTTAEMKQKDTFEGWDFENVWGIDSTINNGYPYLRGF